MNTHARRLAASVAVAGGLALAAAPRPAAAQTFAYQFTTLPIPDAANSRAVGLTDAGVAAGVYDINGIGVPPFYSYLYDTHTGVSTRLDFSALGDAQLDAFSNSGVALGDYLDASGTDHAFTWSAGGVTPIPDPFGIVDTQDNLANGIDYNLGGYDRQGVPVGGSLNSDGTFVGFYSADGANFSSYVDKNGTATDFHIPGADYTNLYGISDAGTLFGTYFPANLPAQGFTQTAAGTFVSYNVPGGRNTEVYGGNDSGGLFGDFNTVRGGPFSDFVLYDGQFIPDVEAPGAAFTSITAMNASGQIAGYYNDAQGVRHSFFATPVAAPEPSGLILLALGAAGLCLKARHRI